MEHRTTSWRPGLLLGCLLFACGGGDGQSSGDFGSGLAIDKTALTFTAVSGGPVPAQQTVLATISASDAATLQVGYTAGNAVADWLTASATATQNPATVTFSMKDTTRSPGTYTARPSIGIFRSDGSVIAVRTVAVTYQVTQ